MHQRRVASSFAVCVAGIILIPGMGRAETGSKSEQATRARWAKDYGDLPLAFEANRGQSDRQVKFLARGRGYTLFLTPHAAVLKLSKAGQAPGETPAVLRMKLAGANREPEITGLGELGGKSNYFIGNDPKKWRTNVPNYAKVRYRNAYPGVDLVYYGNQQQLEYDFVVAPGADLRAITLDLAGGAQTGAPLQIAGNGDLVVPTGGGEVRFHKPVVYQADERSARQSVDGRWVLKGASRAGFEVAAYDLRKTLVIDPVLSYSTFLGGSGNDDAQGIAVDSAGNAYVSGGALSTDFPTLNPFQPTNHGGTDAFVTKLNPSGSALVYSTYLGGSGYDSTWGMTIDASGNVYVAGSTGSKNFPTTPGAFQTVCAQCSNAASDLFVTKLNTTGSALVYSTFLGGTGNDRFLQGIAVDTVGHAYVTGWTTSSNFPTTPGAFQTTLHGSTAAFVTEFNPSGSALVYSTYLTGNGSDLGAGLALDSAGNAYISGYTSSTDFPTTPGAFQTTSHGGFDAFVTKVNPTGSGLVYSTYLGGSSTENANTIALDSSGNAYVTGFTCSADYPITPGAFQITYKAGSCSNLGGTVFVTALNATGSALLYSTFLGGTGNDVAFAIAVDAANVAYLTGRTSSADFPTTHGALQTIYGGGSDVFLAELSGTGSTLLYSTYLGGSGSESAFSIALDTSGSVYLAGRTLSANFPTTPGAFNPTCSKCGAVHGFAAKFAAGDQVWPLSLNFGNQTVGTSSNPQITTFTNSGETTLNLTGITITGSDSGDFSQTHTCGTSLAAGASCTISVIFKPLASGARTAQVALTDDAANSPQTVALSGVGAGAVTLSPPSLTFPVQVVSTSSPAQPITLTNGGATALTITSIAASSPFSQTNNCGSSIAAGTNCTINVVFQPTTKGTQSGSLTVTDNGPGSQQTATLTGTGTFVSLAPASLSFGSQAVGTTSSPQTVTATNQGNATVNISKISFTGAGAGSFGETTTCAGTLATGNSCAISVTFTPKAKGKFGATLAVTDDGGGSPQKVSVTGTGN
jgi:Abnormal spindle-like microcephaly-assoc'd, ASPM-SPD-2-Hydin/Beta-propeller repeat